MRALTVLLFVAATTAAHAAEPLSAAEIEAAVAGATTSGVNAYGNPYTVRILANGTTEGVAGADGEYVDTGSWWIEGDAYCRRWNAWLEGTTACFTVMLDGDRIHWQDTTTGTVVTESYLPPP